MAEYLLKDQTLNFTTTIDGLYSSQEAAPTITAGKTYTVIWDGKAYVCVAKEETLTDTVTVIVLGNYFVTNEEREDTGEPFFYIYQNEQSGEFQTLETNDSHVVSLYETESGYVMHNQTVEFISDESVDIEGVLFAIDPLPKLVDGNPPLVAGKKYTVVWDGTPYTRFVYSAGFDGVLDSGAIGNVSILNPSVDNTGEPFLILYNFPRQQNGVTSAADVIFTGEGTTHSISIYECEDQHGYLVENKALTFATDPTTGLFSWQSTYQEDVIAFVFVENETYTVVWDGVQHVVTAKAMSFGNLTGIGVGNEGLIGIGADNGQPFIFAYLTTSRTNGCYTNEPDESHTISIYRGNLLEDSEEMTSANIVLLDRNGNPVTYEGIKTVSFNTTDGKVATYTLLAISS